MLKQTRSLNRQALRISIDSKAKVKIGNLSRGGKARTIEPLQADDHDHEWSEVLVPFGILDIKGEKLSIYFGTSAETSDFIVDCLENWWRENQPNYPGLEELAKGNHPQVNLVKQVYEKGVTVSASELERFQEFWQQGDVLSQWDITIFPPPE